MSSPASLLFRQKVLSLSDWWNFVGDLNDHQYEYDGEGVEVYRVSMNYKEMILVISAYNNISLWSFIDGIQCLGLEPMQCTFHGNSWSTAMSKMTMMMVLASWLSRWASSSSRYARSRKLSKTVTRSRCHSLKCPPGTSKPPQKEIQNPLLS